MTPSARAPVRPRSHRRADAARPAPPATPGCRARLQRILDAIVDVPAVVQNGRLDVLSANRLGYALYVDTAHAPGRPMHHACYACLDERAERAERAERSYADVGRAPTRP